jgi:ketosteroid isomerase-like protein
MIKSISGRLPLRFLRSVTFALFTVTIAVSSGAQQKSRPADQQQVINTVKALFAAATVDDLAKFNSIIVPGYYMFDGGERFEGDAIMKLIHDDHAKGIRYEWNVTDPDVHVSGNTAWIAYVNRGSITDAQGKVTKINWLESAFLEKLGGTWKIAFIHRARAVTPAAQSGK